MTRGDKARRANRWSEAIEAYEAGLLAAERAALSVEERYSIISEIVICEIARGNYATAGNRLTRFESQFPADKPDPKLRREQQERLNRAFNELVSKAARALISVHPPEAKVYLDGNPIESLDDEQKRKLHIDWLFVDPGERDLSVQLEGHRDVKARALFVAGQPLIFEFKLERKALAIREPSNRRGAPRTTRERSDAKRVPLRVQERVGTPLFRGLETMSLGMGVVPLVGFGVTPGTNVGVSVDGTYRTGSLSLNAEMRIMGSQVIEGEDGIRVIRGGTNLSACGHLNVAFLCGLAGWSRIEGLPGRYIKIVDTDEPVSGNFGLRSGVEWKFNDRIALRAFGELSYTMGQPSVWVNRLKYWGAPPIAGILGLGFVMPMVDHPQDKTAASNRVNVIRPREM